MCTQKIAKTTHDLAANDIGMVAGLSAVSELSPPDTIARSPGIVASPQNRTSGEARIVGARNQRARPMTGRPNDQRATGGRRNEP